jgi:hypothetical protein
MNFEIVKFFIIFENSKGLFILIQARALPKKKKIRVFW